MRIIFKIIAAPFVPILTILWAVLVFMFCWLETILQYVSGLAGLIAIVLFIIGQTTGGIVFAVIAFLICPLGLPAIAKWLIDILFNINKAIKNYIAA